MSEQKKYRVTWSIDVEDENINTPEEAADDCYRRITESRTNDWVWEVIDLDTGKKYEVDCGFEPVEITEI